MGLKDKLTNKGSILSSLNGSTPPIPDLKGSKLHNEYSIDGKPIMPNKLPPPSILDLDGQVPSYNYRANAPEGRTF